MKKLVGLAFLAFIVFVLIYRQRVFLRDPLATVTRDGHKQAGVGVMINYNNDILMDDGSSAQHRIYLVEGWNKVPQFLVTTLKCIHGIACMTDADQARGAPVPAGPRGRRSAFEGVTMTNRKVEFVDEDGALVEVTLR